MIGIIIPTKKRFDQWVRTWGKPDKKYVHINHTENIRGMVFSEVIIADDWHTIDNADQILKESNYRIVTKPQKT